ncbi:MAG: FAD-dependent oxidoreductase [Nitrosomonadaceae bacterium]|nr:FAD-dependent oxidoreductase [Nitrosomonadaceae bacterium]
MKQPVIIVGSGLAGYTLAREFRKSDNETPVLILSRDHGGFYSKPTLSNALATGKTSTSLLISSAENMAEKLKVAVRPYSQVTIIEPSSKTLVLLDGAKLHYSQLILALGADSIDLPLKGDGVKMILSVNDLDDYHHFRCKLEGKKRVTILGAGLIGCEFANDLATTGCHVHVIDISSQPLGRLLPQAGGNFLQRKLEAIGVVFHLDVAAQHVEKVGEFLRLTLSNGKIIDTDLLLSAVGLRPRTALAKAAGIEVNRGIVVNQLLQTRYPDIYALGDCVEVEGKVLPFVMPIIHAARALGLTLGNKPTQVHYPAMPVLVKTPACPIIVSLPNPNTKGEWQIEENKDSIKALFQDTEKNLLGYALLGLATAERAALTARLPPVMQ